MKFCVARTFLGELHLEDVLMVLLVVGLKVYFRQKLINIILDLVDKQRIESISNFNIDVLCWNSPKCCPRGSPDGCIRFFTKLVDKYYRKIHWKN